MKYPFAVLLFLHGLILFGSGLSARGMNLGVVPVVEPGPWVFLWLMSGLGMIGTAIRYLMGSKWIASLVWALGFSQLGIVMNWGSTWFGSIPNLILLVPVASAARSILPGGYTRRFIVAAKSALSQGGDQSLVTEAELAHLPLCVQNYLRFAGVVGRARIRNFRAVFEGEFRSGFSRPWAPFVSEQYNTLAPRRRYFLMKLTLFGLPLEGLHIFQEGKATMEISLASLKKLITGIGPKMDQGETVTVFNDMCLLAPSALLDKDSITWESVDPLRARARFTNEGRTITAELRFHENGALINFLSRDRYQSEDGKTYTLYPWSTPVREYLEVEGRKIAKVGEAVWHRPEGDFSYGRMNLKEIQFNLEEVVK